MAYALLVVLQFAGLILIPFGLPGVWLQVVALAAYGWLTDFATVGWAPIAAAAAIAAAAEVIEFWLGGRFARKYGGSRRAAWGAILGGVLGAVVGVPLPIVGSVIGAFAGAFLGALAMELTLKAEMRDALRVGWGAFVGRLVATAVKSGLGVAVAVIALFSALR